MSPLTAHVLDVVLGRPAAKLAVRLDVLEESGAWTTLAARETNEDGRVPDLLPDGALRARTYRMTFDTGRYLAAAGRAVFYPHVNIVFIVDAPAEHYHIPLLLSTFGYSTYRGS